MIRPIFMLWDKKSIMQIDKKAKWLKGRQCWKMKSNVDKKDLDKIYFDDINACKLLSECSRKNDDYYPNMSSHGSNVGYNLHHMKSGMDIPFLYHLETKRFYSHLFQKNGKLLPLEERYFKVKKSSDPAHFSKWFKGDNDLCAEKYVTCKIKNKSFAFSGPNLYIGDTSIMDGGLVKL